MLILIPNDWEDYALLDSGNGQRLEKYGPYILVRPDPQCIWKPNLPESTWRNANAVFTRTSGEKGFWKKSPEIPVKWLCRWKNVSFWVKLSPFKHTGVFPEQAIHWEFISSVIAKTYSVIPAKAGIPKKKSRSELDPRLRGDDKLHEDSIKPHILNLFGYTGIASIAAAAAGAKVTHIDASYPTIGWARENQKASGLDNPLRQLADGGSIRWILDDALKFCEREIKRGVKYDGIIMDPPIYGHGPKGELWKFEESFPQLMNTCKQLLSDKPIFVIVNAYAISASAIMLENVLNDYLGNLGGSVVSGELALQEQNSNRLLSTGIFSRWSNS